MGVPLKKRMLVMAAALGLAFSVAAPVVAAHAGSGSGTVGCAGQYGWSTVSGTTAETVFQRPPGSTKTYLWLLNGTKTLVAAYSDGSSKPGGGYWSVTDGYNWSNYCRTFG